MIIQCNQCLWQGTIDQWEFFGDCCPNCPCKEYTIIKGEYGD